MPITNFSLDLSNVPDQAEAVPEGDYTFMVEKVELKESKDSAKSPYLNWVLNITGPAQVGRKLFMITSLSEKSLWRLKANFKALGVPTSMLNFIIDPGSSIVLNPPLTGLVGIARVIIEVYEGRNQNRVNDILPISAGATALVQPGAAPAQPGTVTIPGTTPPAILPPQIPLPGMTLK